MSNLNPTERAYLHVSTWAADLAYPVDVLARGRKFARVRLRHKTRIGYTLWPRGTIKRRVPISSLGEKPKPGALVSLGGGRFR